MYLLASNSSIGLPEDAYDPFSVGAISGVMLEQAIPISQPEEAQRIDRSNH